MSYTCVDAYSDLTGALNLKTPDEWNEDGNDHVSEETDLALAEIVRLQRVEKVAKALLRKCDELWANLADSDMTADEGGEEYRDMRLLRLAMERARRSLAR